MWAHNWSIGDNGQPPGLVQVPLVQVPDFTGCGLGFGEGGDSISSRIDARAAETAAAARPGSVASRS
jgi:hypothetical protein